MIIITYPCKDFKEPWRNQLNDKPRQKSLQFRMVGLTGLEPVTPRLSSACSNQLSYKPYKNGGAEEIRTPDILLAKQALYQLSYSPKDLEPFTLFHFIRTVKERVFRSLKTELCNSIHQSSQQAGMFDRTGIHTEFVLPSSAGTSSP